MAEISPCPFCGHVGLEFAEGSTFRWIVASCEGCGASRGETRIQTLGEGTKEEWMAIARDDAIVEWNRRAALAAPAVVVSAEPVAHVAAELLSQVAGTEFVMAMLCREPHEYTVPLYATPVGPDAVDADQLRSALERLANNYRLTLAGKPVRDVTETLAEVDAALASTRPSKGAA